MIYIIYITILAHFQPPGDQISCVKQQKKQISDADLKGGEAYWLKN